MAKFDDYGNFCVWVEFVGYGHDGWIYGQQEYMAFEKPHKDGFLCVSTNKLREWCEKNIKLEFVNNKDEAWYKLYVRRHQYSFDCVALIGYKDIESIGGWEV